MCGAVVTGGFAGQMASAFFVGKVEGCFKVGEGSFDRRSFAPVSDGVGEEAGGFKIFKTGTNGRRFGNRID